MSYIEALFPEPVEIFGNTLRPFSLGHELVLRRLGVDGRKGVDGDLTIDETLIIVAVCTMSYNQAWQWFTSGEFAGDVQAWANELQAEMDVGNASQIAEAKPWVKRYLSAGFKEPRIEHEQPGGGLCEIPLAEHVLQTLARDCGVTLKQALNMPRPLAMWKYYAALEMSGKYGVKVRQENSELSIKLRAKAEEMRNASAKS